MKKQKTIGKRVMAAALGTVLVLALLTGISTVTGNPLVAAMGRNRVARYVAETYSLEENVVISPGIQEAAGSFTYWYSVVSMDSPDTKFEVQVPLFGKITDNYEYWVTQLHNTRTRLGNEMAFAALTAMQATPYGRMVQESRVEYGYLLPSEEETFPEIPYKEEFTLDMPFDRNAVTVPTLLTLKVTDEGASQEMLDKMLPEIRAAMEQSGLWFDYYTVVLDTPDALYDAGGFVGVYTALEIPADSIG